MKTTKLLISSLFLLGVCTNVFSQNSISPKVKDLVPGKYYSQLIKEGKVIQTSMEGTGSLALIPQTEYAFAIKENLVTKQKKDFYFTYEGLYYIPNNITVEKASELARSISKLQGITYYSNTKKKDTVLYKQAFTIADENSKTPVADKTAGSANGKTLYCLLDDNSFGETRYRLNYKQSEKELLTSFRTIDDMGLGPIRAIMPENLSISLLVIPCEDGIIVYLCADLDSKNLPGVKAKITESITARMDAISKWFISLT